MVPKIAPPDETVEEAADRRKSWGEALPRTSACVPCLLAREHCYPYIYTLVETGRFPPSNSLFGNAIRWIPVYGNAINMETGFW